MLAERLAGGEAGADDGWNFGPDRNDERPVIDVVDAIVGALGKGDIEISQDQPDLHEAKLLRLDSTKAQKIGWSAILDFAQTIKMTADWYADWMNGAPPVELCGEQIESYMKTCGEKS